MLNPDITLLLQKKKKKVSLKSERKPNLPVTILGPVNLQQAPYHPWETAADLKPLHDCASTPLDHILKF